MLLMIKITPISLFYVEHNRKESFFLSLLDGEVGLTRRTLQRRGSLIGQRVPHCKDRDISVWSK
jgi:hypothetical protein